MKTTTKTTIVCALCLCLSYVPTSGEHEPFSQIADRLAAADCLHVDFLHIVESAVFHDVDSMPGAAALDQQGRYRIELPNDQFLCDGSTSYSYSIPNNQIVIEDVSGEHAAAGHELLFLTNLKERYSIRPIVDGKSYKLRQTTIYQSSLPDSMTAYLSEDGGQLDRFEYFDINEDRNSLIIRSLTTGRPCPDSLFTPSWPDSIDRVKL
jgi:outer membrane lipoprotein-sorting protein